MPKSTTISGPPNCRCAGQRVQQPVGADLVGIVDPDLEAPVERGARDQRLDAEPVAAEPAQMIQRGRHHGADHRGGDLGRASGRHGRAASSARRRIRPRCAAASVAMRQMPRQAAPSWTAKTTLVLPPSTTSSMAGAPLSRIWMRPSARPAAYGASQHHRLSSGVPSVPRWRAARRQSDASRHDRVRAGAHRAEQCAWRLSGADGKPVGRRRMCRRDAAMSSANRGERAGRALVPQV